MQSRSSNVNEDSAVYVCILMKWNVSSRRRGTRRYDIYSHAATNRNCTEQRGDNTGRLLVTGERCHECTCVCASTDLSVADFHTSIGPTKRHLSRLCYFKHCLFGKSENSM
jgi:hypothetical protein